MFNPKLILNTASELGLSVKINGKFYQIVKKIDQFKPKNKEDILILAHFSARYFDVDSFFSTRFCYCCPTR